MISVKDIDACLPQTQCGQCSYDGCLPYAQAISEGTPHNQCPPGGERVIQKLSKLLDRKPLPLNPENGVEKAKVIAVIREPECIGCTKCIQACPVDAIMGASRVMHTVISDECTGCELCVEPCPVDCIDLVPAKQQPADMPDSELVFQADHFRDRMNSRDVRLKVRAAEKKMKHQRNKNVGNQAKTATVDDKKAFIAEAIKRAKSRNRNSEQNQNPSNL